MRIFYYYYSCKDFINSPIKIRKTIGDYKPSLQTQKHVSNMEQTNNGPTNGRIHRGKAQTIVFDVQKDSDRNGPVLTEISQPLHVMLNPYQRRVQERKMKNLSTASWKGPDQEPIQPKLTSRATSKTAVSAHKPSFFKKIKKVLRQKTKRQSVTSEEYVEHLAEEILGRVLRIEPKIGHKPTVTDLFEYFTKDELSLVWDAVHQYYPDIYSTIPEVLEGQEVTGWI